MPQAFAHAIKIGVEFKQISIRINTKIKYNMFLDKLEDHL